MTSGGQAHRDTRWTTAVSIVSAAAAIRLVFAAVLPVFPDEAYYWEWSRRLAAGYFDHPPAVALLIRFGTTILGSTPLGIRLGSIIAGWIASLFTIMIARRLAGGDGSIAIRAAIIMSVLPLAAAGLVLATPDAPLLAATAATLYCVLRAVEAGHDSRTSTRWWVAAGVSLGAAFLSKYTAVLVPAGVLAAFATRPSLRWRLKDYGPYIACAVAALIFLPVVFWNARHDWVSFAFQLRPDSPPPEARRAAPRVSLRRSVRGQPRWRRRFFRTDGNRRLASLDQTATDGRVPAIVALVCFAFFVVRRPATSSRIGRRRLRPGDALLARAVASAARVWIRRASVSPC